MNHLNSSNIRIAELFFFLNMGGVEKCIVNLMNYLPTAEFDKCVIVSQYGGMMEKQLFPEIKFTKLPETDKMLHLIRHLREVDLVHLNTINLNPFFTWSAAMADVPVIIDTVHSSVDNPYASYVDFTVCISKHVANLHSRPERTGIIYNGVEITGPSLKDNKKRNKHVVILEMRRPDKEVQATLVDLYQKLECKENKIECWIMGIEGESNDELKFLGKVSDPSPYLAKADFLFHFPTHEALGNVLIEGMAHGVIPIAYNVGGISEIVHDGINGICTDLADQGEIIKLLKNVVLEYLSSPGRFELLRMECIKTVEEKFDITKTHNSYKELFISQIEKKSGQKRRPLVELLESNGLEKQKEFLELLEFYCFNPGQGFNRLRAFDLNKLTIKQQAFVLGIVGRELQLKGLYEEARKYLEAAITKWDDEFYLNLYLGEVEIQSRSIAESGMAFKKACSLDDTNMLAAIGYLQCLLEMGDFVPAKQICSKLLDVLPPEGDYKKLINRIYDQIYLLK